MNRSKNKSMISNSTNAHSTTKSQNFDFFYNKKPPIPIRQTKISLPDQMIKQIPYHINPQLILHLYLSHNQIQSLNGMQSYINLQSLNISYNKLSKKQEFVKYMGTYLQKVKKLCIRMNNFHYGIEDYVIQIFPSLQKLDDVSLGNFDKKKEAWISKMKISDKIIQSLMRTQRILQFLQDMEQKEHLNSQLKLKASQSQNQQNLKLIHQNISQNTIVSLARIVNNQKGNQNIYLQNCIKIISLFLQSDLKCTCRPYNYLQMNQKKFIEILNKIMVRFAERNNKKFIQGLERIIIQNHLNKKQLKNTKTQIVSAQYIHAFGVMGGYNYCIDDKPGKYIRQLYKSEIKKQPIAQFAQKQNIDKKKLKYTLNGPEDDKWRKFKQKRDQISNKQNLAQLLNERQQQQIFHQEDSEWLFQSIPMFIYEPNYLQIIHQILFQEKRKILNLYDKISQNRMKSNHKLQKQKRKKSINTNLKKQNIYKRSKILDQIIFQNQKQQQLTFKDNNDDSLDFILSNDDKFISQSGININQRKTLPMFKKQNEKMQTKVPFHQSSNIETLRVIINSRSQQFIEPIGYKKYTLHQINIIYKSLRGLKKNILQKRKRKKVLNLN